MRYRTYATDLGAGAYAVSVAAIEPTEYPIELVVEAIGDDQKAPTELKTATLHDGTPLTVKDGGVVGPLTLPKSGSLLLEVRLKEPVRVSMEVSAHEA